MENELLGCLKAIKNKEDLKNVISTAIKNGYDILFLDDRYCAEIDTRNYDIEVDNSDIIRILAPSSRPYIRHYNNMYRSIKFTKATPISNEQDGTPIYNIRNNLIMY